MFIMDTKFPNQEFYVWLVHLQGICDNRSWKRASLQIMIFVCVCTTWGIVELNMRFEAWRTRNILNGECLFHLSYLITHMAYLCTQWTPHVQNKYFMFDCWIYRPFVVNRSWKHDSPNNVIRICLLDMRRSWIKNAFWSVNKKKWRKWWKFVSPSLSNTSYGLPVLTMHTTCPNQVFYV
jgi:hypothetical protein